MNAPRHSAVRLLVVLLLLFLTAPFVEDLPGGDLIEAALLTLVMVLAVLAVGAQRRTLTISLLLVTPALAGKWISHFSPGRIVAGVYLLAAVAFFGFVVSHLVAIYSSTPPPTQDGATDQP